MSFGDVLSLNINEAEGSSVLYTLNSEPPECSRLCVEVKAVIKDYC